MSPWVLGTEQASIFPKSKNTWRLRYASKGICRWTFVQGYNFGKHSKALRWKTPFRATCEAWEKDPGRFRLHQHHLTVGLNIQL